MLLSFTVSLVKRCFQISGSCFINVRVKYIPSASMCLTTSLTSPVFIVGIQDIIHFSSKIFTIIYRFCTSFRDFLD